MLELGQTLGRFNPFARRESPAVTPARVSEVSAAQPQTRPEPLLSIAQPLERKTGEKFSERHLWRAWESVQHVAAGVATRQVVKAATTAALGEAGGSATAGIMAFINTTKGVLFGKETAADVYRKRAYHIAGGSVSEWHQQEKQEEKKAAGKSWLSSIGSAIKGGLNVASKAFNIFENASTQVVYGVTRKRAAVSSEMSRLQVEQDADIKESSTWEKAFAQRLQSMSGKQETRRVEKLAGNLSYLSTFDHGKIDVYGKSGSDIHKVREELTPEVITAMREGLQRAVTLQSSNAGARDKVLTRIEKKVNDKDEKHKGRTVALGLLNAAAAAVKVVGVGKIVDIFKGHETVAETSQADLSGQYEPIQVPPEQVAQVTGSVRSHLTDSQLGHTDFVAATHVASASRDVVRAYELNDHFDTAHDYVSDTAHAAGGATDTLTTAHLPSIDTIKSVSHDGTLFGGARELASQVHQSDKSILSNWPKSLNITNIAGNEQSILTNGLQKWMSLTGHGLDLEHAEKLSSLIAEAHRQTAILEAAGHTWKDLPPELKTAFMLSEGIANNVSEDDALKILGIH